MMIEKHNTFSIHYFELSYAFGLTLGTRNGVALEVVATFGDNYFYPQLLI